MPQSNCKEKPTKVLHITKGLTVLMPGSMLSEIATPRSDPGESAPARHASPSDNMITDERNETEKKKKMQPLLGHEEVNRNFFFQEHQVVNRNFSRFK